MRDPDRWFDPVEGPTSVDPDDLDVTEEVVEEETPKPRVRRRRVKAEVPDESHDDDEPYTKVEHAQEGIWIPDKPADPPQPDEDWAERTSHNPLSNPDKPRGV